MARGGRAPGRRGGVADSGHALKPWESPLEQKRACGRERGLDHSGDCGLRGSGRRATVNQGQETLGRGLGPLFPSPSGGQGPASARLS